MSGLDGQLENEHFCLSLASALGIAAARSEVRHFGSEVAIVSERFDRLPRADGTWARVHQEDMCQALAVMPDRKYQSDGGPSPETIVVDVLRNSAAAPADVRDDVGRFLRSVAFNWIVLGTDAHAKNFSVIHGRAGAYRLAPLYDVNSALPYDDPADVRMSFRIGGRYRFDLFPRHWERLARGCRFDADELIGMVRTMLADMPDATLSVARDCADAGLAGAAVGNLADRIAGRCLLIARAWSMPHPR